MERSECLNALGWFSGTILTVTHYFYDGKRILFLSTMPKDSTDNPGDEDIWCADREGDGWGEPINLGPNINSPTGSEWSPNISPDGKYFFFMASGRTSPDDKPDSLSYEFFREIYIEMPVLSNLIRIYFQTSISLIIFIPICISKELFFYLSKKLYYK